MTQLFIQTMWKTHLNFHFFFKKTQEIFGDVQEDEELRRCVSCLTCNGELFLTCQVKMAFFRNLTVGV